MPAEITIEQATEIDAAPTGMVIATETVTAIDVTETETETEIVTETGVETGPASHGVRAAFDGKTSGPTTT